MKSTPKNLEDKRPMQFVYYMTQLEDSPCQICVVQPLCQKSFIDDSACRELGNFIREKIEEIEDENKN